MTKADKAKKPRGQSTTKAGYDLAREIILGFLAPAVLIDAYPKEVELAEQQIRGIYCLLLAVINSELPFGGTAVNYAENGLHGFLAKAPASQIRAAYTAAGTALLHVDADPGLQKAILEAAQETLKERALPVQAMATIQMNATMRSYCREAARLTHSMGSRTTAMPIETPQAIARRVNQFVNHGQPH